MFVHFPIGLWTTSLAWDAAALSFAKGSWWTLSYWSLVAGLVMALPAIGTGLVEFIRMEQGHPAVRTAIWHMSAMSGAAVLFLGSLLLRNPTTSPDSVIAALSLSLSGLVCLMIGGVFASRLVYGYGVGMK